MASLTAGIVLIESAYRIRLAFNPYKPLEPGPERFTASPSVYGVEDKDFGVRYLPGSSQHVVNVTADRRVTWAPELPISSCNADGFMGRTLRADYEAAELKILVFGDSFTHWSQEGATWPDLLETELATLLGRRVAVLNAARGGYGVLQMFDLAAHLAPELAPDLVVIAFISDDVTRARWWTRTIERGGFTRPLLSPKPDDFSLAIAADEYVVDPRITPEWARAALADPAKGEPLLGELVAQYRTIKREFYEARGIEPVERGFFTLRELYIWNRIVHGTPVEHQVTSIPRVTYTDFSEDARFLADVERLRAQPMILLHLPESFELADRKPSWQTGGWFGPPARTRHLVSSLTRLTGLELALLEQETEGVRLPEKIDLLPHNGHPNRVGLELYAELAAKVIVRKLAR